MSGRGNDQTVYQEASEEKGIGRAGQDLRTGRSKEGIAMGQATGEAKKIGRMGRATNPSTRIAGIEVVGFGRLISEEGRHRNPSYSSGTMLCNVLRLGFTLHHLILTGEYYVVDRLG